MNFPLSAWTDARNIRFLDGCAYQFYGHGEVYNSPSCIPHHLIPVVIGTQRYWLYAGLEKDSCGHDHGWRSGSHEPDAADCWC